MVQKDGSKASTLKKMKPKDMVQMSWSDFQKSTTGFVSESRLNSDFTDVTLVCNDRELTQVTAHKIILAAGSTFFESLLRRVSQSCPLIFLRGVETVELETILSFLYTGEASVQKARLEKFLAVANDLGVKGFCPEVLGSLDDQNEDQENEEHVDLKEKNYESDKLVEFNNEQPNEILPTLTRYSDFLDSEHVKCKFCDTVAKTEKSAAGGLTIKEHLVAEHLDHPVVVENLNKFGKKHLFGRTFVSPVWRFATRFDQKRAECKLCKRLMYAEKGTTSTLRSHMLKFHEDNVDIVAAFAEKKAALRIKNKNDSPHKGSGLRSPVWNFATRLTKKRAMCNICSKEISVFESSTKYVLKHLIDQHAEDNQDVYRTLVTRNTV